MLQTQHNEQSTKRAHKRLDDANDADKRLHKRLGDVNVADPTQRTKHQEGAQEAG